MNCPFLKQARVKIARIPLPPGYSVAYGGEAESQANMTGGIVKAVRYAKELAQGNLKINVEAHELERKDEMGSMSRATATLIQNMRASIGAIQNSMQTLASASTLMAPGVMQLTWILYSPISRARERVRPITPPFDAT